MVSASPYCKAKATSWERYASGFEHPGSTTALRYRLDVQLPLSGRLSYRMSASTAYISEKASGKSAGVSSSMRLAPYLEKIAFTVEKPFSDSIAVAEFSMLTIQFSRSYLVIFITSVTAYLLTRIAGSPLNQQTIALSLPEQKSLDLSDFISSGFFQFSCKPV